MYRYVWAYYKPLIFLHRMFISLSYYTEQGGQWFYTFFLNADKNPENATETSVSNVISIWRPVDVIGGGKTFS